MSFKFPFTNYHELNLTWVLEQLKQLFTQSAENVAVIENYDERLTAVETELPTVAETSQNAAQTAAAASTVAQTAQATANAAQENAIQAQSIAGYARQEAQQAQTAADAASQAAQQAQATAQNFDGRITQAQNDAAAALQASQSFENRVQAAITTANNAAQTATDAQGIAMRADQNAALALDTLNAQRSELERIGAEQAALITEETEDKKTEIENLAQSVLDSIPTDYTELSALVDKKAPVIINTASGSIASFNDGADNMKVQKLVVNVEPIQAGSGDPSPTNIRPISGHTGAEISRTAKNLILDTAPWNIIGGGSIVAEPSYNAVIVAVKKGETYTCSVDGVRTGPQTYAYYNSYPAVGSVSYDGTRITTGNGTVTAPITGYLVGRYASGASNIQVERGSDVTAYEEPKGNQISVTFPSAAGTVYGGTLTLNPDRTGTLMVDRGYYTPDRNANIYMSASRAFISYDDAITIDASNQLTEKSVMCDRLPSVTWGQLDNVDIGCSPLYGNGIAFKFNGYTTAEEYKAYFLENEVTFYFKLKNPITYQLTASEISGILTSLYGTNNVLADTGDVEVEYPADTKLYIDGKIAELQATILENI